MQTHPEEGWPCYYDASGQPVFRPPTRLLPSTTVILYEPYVADLQVTWRVLCHQRRDNQQWGFVGGAQELGESILQCAVREAREETGLEILLERFCCLDSDPAHGAIAQYPNGDVVQYTNCTFTARSSGGLLAPSAESLQLGWYPVTALPQPFLPTHYWRLQQALALNKAPGVR